MMLFNWSNTNMPDLTVVLLFGAAEDVLKNFDSDCI